MAQVPPRHRHDIAAQLDLDVEQRTGDATDPASDAGLITRLRIVEEFLDRAGEIGSADEGRGYFRGPLALNWGPYGENFAGDNAGFVYFGGRTTRTIVGLGGSRRHVIGEAGAAHPHSHSGTPQLIDALRHHLGEGDGTHRAADQRRRWDPLWLVELATTQMRGPREQMQFVARRLAAGTPRRAGAAQVLLGTPLYVALA